ncbi:hypothetical protein WAI453_008704 [Rhynchosporium graminicola]
MQVRDSIPASISRSPRFNASKYQQKTDDLDERHALRFPQDRHSDHEHCIARLRP